MNLSETNDFELLELLLEAEGITITNDQVLIPRRGLQKAPASFQQRRLWFLHELEPNSSAYNICSVFCIDGQMRIEALKQAFQKLQQRHESLRTTFASIDGEPWQYIHPQPLTEIISTDWSHLSTTEINKQITAVTSKEARYTFDLENGPLIRMGLFKLNSQQYILTLTMHHIIADGWSIGVFLEELATLYKLTIQGEINSLPELKIQYADYAVWQQENFSGSALETHLNYWEKQLAELPVLQFPHDFPRPRLQSFRGDLVNFTIPPELTRAIRAFSQEADATLFMTLMAAFTALLARYSGQQDIAVGTSIANRPGSDTEKLIGFFVNMLVIRADLSGEANFRELVSRVKETVLSGFEHAEVPFEFLVDRLNIERDTSRNPLFQIAFTLLNAPKPNFGEGNLAVKTLASQDAARFDLELFITEHEDSLSGVFSYNIDLFTRETVEQIQRHFCNLLQNLVTQPEMAVSRVPILLPDEYAQLMPVKPQQSFPVELCLHEVFHQQVALRPHRTALIFENQSLTYQELSDRANQLAHYLISLGVKPESKVGLWVSRSCDMIVGILAVLKAGATYVPFDPEYPRERVAYMLADSQVEILLTQQEFASQIPPHAAKTIFLDCCVDELSAQKTTNPQVAVTPDNAAYIIYTSGSTGQPKGVVVTHRNVVRLMLATAQWYHFNEKDVWTLFHSYAFDFSVWEIWGALFFGGKLVIVPYLVSRSPEDFYNLLCDARVTVLNQTPSAFRQLIQAEAVICRESELNLRYVIFGGEALDLASLEPWFERHDDEFPQLVNMYGITETTVHVTYRQIRLRDVKKNLGSVIGKPIPDLSFYILDAYKQPVPIGVVGEIYVGGAGVTRGYLHRPQLTAERIVPHPANPEGEERLYKTGDLARYLPNGEIEYLGRNDHQVKIRGFRIELGEIEAVLQRHPGVREARVMTWGENEDVRLVAYVVPQTDLQTIPNHELLTVQQKEEWQYTFDETYGGILEETEIDFNITGWNNSYDGQPIPSHEMRAWLDYILAKIKTLSPQRVLEIGCGTGMILFNIAPQVTSYWASDFSQSAIKRLKYLTQQQNLSNIDLLHQEAIDFHNIPESYFDTIIINSVAQYFSSIEYLQQVIQGALNALAPGGSLFIGDNRHLPLLSAFHSSIALAQASNSTDKAAFTEILKCVAAKENELVIDPNFFVNLPQIFTSVAAVEVHLKGENTDNELTKYRYDVVIHKQGGDNDSFAGEPIWQQNNLQLNDLPQLLNQLEYPIGWQNIPNARSLQDQVILQWLQSQENTPATVGELRELLTNLNVETAVNPSDLLAIAQASGCEAIISYSPNNATEFDVCFYPAVNEKVKRRSPKMPITQTQTPLKAIQAYATNPIQGTLTQTLIPQLKEQVREQLPEYMRPTAFMLLDKFPLTPSGKLDRRALPAPSREGITTQDTFVKPNTPTQEKLCRIWSDVLGSSQIGLTDDFFQLGGHSLLATKLVSRIRDEFHIALPLRTVFEYPTVAGQAEQIDLLSVDTQQITQPDNLIPKLDHRENLPLSFAQQRLWFLDKLEPDNPAYNIVVGFRMDGYLHSVALQRALQEIVQRHEVLRTTFSQDAQGNPIQIIHESQQLSFTTTDLSHLSPTAQEQELQQVLTQEALCPFNLETGPLLRVHLYRLAENVHVFAAVMHHIIADAWSLGIIVKELSQLYPAYCSNQESPLSPLSLQYADFAHWQRTTFTQTQLQQQLEYWKQELKGEIQPLELPTDYPRQAIATYNGSEVSFTVDLQNYQAFKQLCESQNATLFMGLLGVFKTLLMRYSGQHDLLVGTPIANRNHRQTEDLIGFFVNTLVIRTDLSDYPTFSTLLERIKEKTLQAYAHQDVPFEKLVEELQPERNLSHNPLFQVMLVLQNAPIGKLELPLLSFTPLEMASTTVKFDLSLSLAETETGLQGVWEYNTDLFDASTITRMVEHFQILLAAIVANPQQPITELPLLTSHEQQLLNYPNSQLPTPHSLIHWIETQVERTPNAIAVEFDNQQLTYKELNHQANQLAHYLQSLGVKPEVLVGICVERSLEMVVGLLGILKAGGAYVPLDPTYPQERLAFMLADSQVSVLLTQQHLLEQLPTHQASVVCLDTDWLTISQHSQENPVTQIQPENLAYVIYTSGSTGKPKGVTIQHNSLVNYTEARINEYRLVSDDKCLQFASISFDGAVAEIYSCLSAGATLVLRTDEMLSSVTTFIQKCQDYQITVAELPAAYWQQITFELAQGNVMLPASIRVLVIAGDRIPPEQLDKWRQYVGEYPQLINEYGPTETTVSATSCDLSALKLAKGREVPIGKPLPNIQTYLLDQNLQPVPIGIPGELYIGGVALARGYCYQPNVTAEKFIPHPFSQQPGSRLYKTGDLAKYLPDGNLEFLGRIDNQVKLRGFRIELGEIEAILAKHPLVRQAIAIVREDQGEKRLIAYVVTHPEEVNTQNLRSFLKERLPAYMIPSAFIILDTLPITPNGKLDKKALPALHTDKNTPTEKQIPPRTSLECQLVELWEETLQISSIGVTDNFFDLGGHSLLAIRLITDIEKRLGYSISVATFFQTGTIENLALQIENTQASHQSKVLLPLQTKGNKPPIFLIHPASGYGLTYSVLAQKLGKDQPLYALQSLGLDTKQQPLNTIKEMAATYIKAIREIQPNSPYIIGGYSLGGLIAWEIVHQIEAAGEKVKNLLIIDTHPPLLNSEVETQPDDDIALLVFITEQIGIHFNVNLNISYTELAALNAEQRLEYILQILQKHQLVAPNSGKDLITGLINVYKANSQASLYYQPQPIKSSVSLFTTPGLAAQFPQDATLGWGKLTSTKTSVYIVSGNHNTLLQSPHVQQLSTAIQATLQTNS